MKRAIALLTAALLSATTLLITAPALPAAAAPADSTDDEGGSEALRTALEESTRGFLDAQAALDNSKKRQGELAAEAPRIEARLASLRVETDQIAAAAYRGGGISAAATLLNAGSPEGMLDKAATINVIALRNDRLLRELTGLLEEVKKNRTEVDAEIARQQQQLDVMAKKRQDVEKALQTVGGQKTTAVSGKTAAKAAAAPRRANGTLGSESCSADDPTTGGCLTPRTLHALKQAQAAGFNRFVKCKRAGGSGEHPKGRACDFAAAADTFGGVATGGDRAYGDNLTKFFVDNAKNLGVLYVIWFEKIWSPAAGWRTYTRGNGDPSSDHTNHVHLSVV